MTLSAAASATALSRGERAIRAFFSGRVANAGAAKFVRRAAELGSMRYGPGVQASQDEWAKNTQPYLDRLKSLDLPPKGPRRSPQNQQRAAAAALALGALKTGK